MKYCIEFTFGAGFDKDQRIITISQRDGALEFIKRNAVELFDGYTMFSTAGGWKSPDGRIVEEAGYVLRVLTLTPAIDAFGWSASVMAMSDCIKYALSQQCVCVTASQVACDML